MNESALLHFAEHRLQEVAIAVMATVYTIRIIWFFRFALAKERQARTGRDTTDSRKGSVYSLFNIAMPWAMESTRRNILFYIQFILLHAGLIGAITMSFIIPYFPQIMVPLVTKAFQTIFACAFVIAVYRMIRRIVNPVMRAISTPDDYFSLGLLTVWLFFAFFSAPNNPAQGEFYLLVYFFLTAFFILYVPFSKISHYIYYPFTRIYLGRTLGRRGVFPLERRA
jgi:nitrate reductase gamma subunit